MAQSSEVFFAFSGHELLARGSLLEVARAMKAAADNACEERLSLYIDSTGAPTDLDVSVSDKQLLAQVKKHAAVKGTKSDISAGSDEQNEKKSRGRPRLGVVSKEVSLLPRHWTWLADQPSGASAAIRRLIDAERKKSTAADFVRGRVDAAHRFLWDIAGDLSGFEEASRALYAHDFERFESLILSFPVDIQGVLLRYVGEAKAVQNR